MKSPRRPLPAERGQPRPKVTPAWRDRRVWAVLSLLAMVALGLGGWSVWRTGWVAEGWLAAKTRAVAMTVDAGLRVEEILLVGRKQTGREALGRALGLRRGDSILLFDPPAARARIMALAWVRDATVERLWPDTVLVNVSEREPLAIWQNNGAFRLIDRDGQVILERGLGPFGYLPVVVGEDAPQHAAEILATLEAQPGLMALVKAAVRVGGRRWNVRLAGGIDVHLPEIGAAKAWARLAEYERQHQLSGRDVRVLDLRLPDRLIVRMPERPASPVVPGGRAGRKT